MLHKSEMKVLLCERKFTVQSGDRVGGPTWRPHGSTDTETTRASAGLKIAYVSVNLRTLQIK